MAQYDKKELFETGKQKALDEKLLFIQDIIDCLPIQKTTFYDYFPVGSNEMNELKKILDANKVSIKANLRKRWWESENPTLQLALYKLSSNEEEHRKLSQQYIEQESRNINTDVDLDEFEKIRESIKLK